LIKLEKQGAKIDAVYYCPHHISSNNKELAIECNLQEAQTGNDWNQAL